MFVTQGAPLPELVMTWTGGTDERRFSSIATPGGLTAGWAGLTDGLRLEVPPRCEIFGVRFDVRVISGTGTNTWTLQKLEAWAEFGGKPLVPGSFVVDGGSNIGLPYISWGGSSPAGRSLDLTAAQGLFRANAGHPKSEQVIFSCHGYSTDIGPITAIYLLYSADPDDAVNLVASYGITVQPFYTRRFTPASSIS